MMLDKKCQGVFLLALFLNGAASIVFGFESNLITYAQGDFSPAYTLFSTHFSHHNIEHLAFNLIALWLLLTLFPSEIKLIYISSLLTIILIAIFVIYSGIQTFLGFSALLYCLPGIYCAQATLRKNYNIALSILMILCFYLYVISPIKIIPENELLSFTTAHLIGFISGQIVVFIKFSLNSKLDNQKRLPEKPF